MKARNQSQFKGPGFERQSDKFGGSLLQGNNPKTKRPLESKLPVHLVLRATSGGMRFPGCFKRVNALVASTARKHGVTIYEYANVGNHLHLLIKIRSVPSWAGFIRELTGQIAQFMQEKRKTEGKFWLHRPYTRIVRGWNKAYQAVKMYVSLNHLEGEGFISRRETKTLKDLRLIWDG